MQIFIDTNVFLSFYHLTSDDLEELRKLTVLLEKGDVVLYLPNQVRDEYRRNRENKIAEAMKRLTEQTLGLEFPAVCRDYGQYDELRKLQKEYKKTHADLMQRLSEDVETHSLRADEVISELFEKSERIEVTKELIDKAALRIDLGNPPGKKGSLGDAINWECLLDTANDDEDLYFVTDDKDYYSPIDTSRPKEFLSKEWDERKDSQVHFYRRLSPFFKEHYPDIKLAAELEKELAVQMFVKSAAFATTHNAITRLSKLEGLSQEQANEVAEAALTNNQINWIIGDADVFQFLESLAGEYAEVIDEATLAQLKAELIRESVDEEDDDNDVPFQDAV